MLCATAGLTSNRNVSVASAASSCSITETSPIQIDRPKVPTTRALARMDDERSHPRVRQRALPAHPTCAAVDRDEQSGLVADVQHTWIVRILADDIGRPPGGQIAGDGRPRPAEIGRLEEIRPVV